MVDHNVAKSRVFRCQDRRTSIAHRPLKHFMTTRFAWFRLIVLMLCLAGTAPVPVGVEGQARTDLPKLTLAVLPFETIGEIKGAGWVYDGLINELVEADRFEIVERNRLDRVLQELNLASSSLADPQQAARLGRIIAADLIMIPSVTKGEGVLRMTVRLVDTESAEIFSGHETSELGTSALLLQVLLGRITEYIVSDLPVREGLVIKTEENQVYIDLGQNSGLKRHARILLLDPTSGQDEVIGEGKVVQVLENFLKAEILRSNRPPAVMDLIRTK